MTSRKPAPPVASLIALIVALGLGTGVPAMAESGFYLGAGIGSAGLDEDFDDFRISDDAEAYRVLGGLQFGSTLGIEAGYQTFGDFEERFDVGGVPAIARIKADGWTLGGRLGLPLTDSVSLFGRGGVFVWDADVDINGVRAAVEDDSNPYYGAGAKVGFTRNFSLVGDWTRFELDEVKTDVFTLGFELLFGG